MDLNQPLCLYLEGLDWSSKDLFLDWERSLGVPIPSDSSNVPIPMTAVSRLRDSRPISLDIKTVAGKVYRYMARLNGFYLVLFPLSAEGSDCSCHDGDDNDIVSFTFGADIKFKYDKGLCLGLYKFDDEATLSSSSSPLSLLPVPSSIWLSPFFEMEFHKKECVSYSSSGGEVTITSPAFING